MGIRDYTIGDYLMHKATEDGALIGAFDYSLQCISLIWFNGMVTSIDINIIDESFVKIFLKPGHLRTPSQVSWVGEEFLPQIETKSETKCVHEWTMYQPFRGEVFECCKNCPMTKAEFDDKNRQLELPIGYYDPSMP